MRKKHKNHCHLLLPLLSEVTTESDIHTLTERATQFHIQGNNARKGMVLLFSELTSLHSFTIKLSMETLRIEKGGKYSTCPDLS